MPASEATTVREVRSPPQDSRWCDAVNGALADGKLDFARLDIPGHTLFIPVVRGSSGTTQALSHRSLNLSDALRDPALRLGTRPPVWDTLRVDRVRARSELLAALPKSGIRYALSDAGASAFCDVSRRDALKSLSKDTLRNVDRLKRRAQRHLGEVAIAPIADASVAGVAFDRFVALENVGWKGTRGAGTSLLADESTQRFFREVMRRFQHDGCARIDFLTIGGRDAAAQLMVRAGATWFLLKMSYHPYFKEVGPGGILLKALLEEMRDSPDILEVNLTTNPSWAARWHFQTEPLYYVHIYGRTLKGQLGYAGRLVKEVAKQVRDVLHSRRARRKSAAPPAHQAPQMVGAR